MKKKNRVSIPSEIAARVQFLSDRTCCVCRVPKRPIQIHHVDNDPSNNNSDNLCVLCFDCHRETQISGGFDRKLDSHQILLYRDDWYSAVRETRTNEKVLNIPISEENIFNSKEATSLAEIYIENGDWESLAIHYHLIKNYALRDKYIELALQAPSWDQAVWYLRGLQNRIDLIPEDLIEREIQRLSIKPDFLQRARFFNILNRKIEAISDYFNGIKNRIESKRWFTAAFYLKEMVASGLINELFILSYNESKEEKEIWWQIRSLQELEWTEKLEEVIYENKKEIEKEGNIQLLELLFKHLGDKDLALEYKIKHAKKGYGPGLKFPVN